MVVDCSAATARAPPPGSALANSDRKSSPISQRTAPNNFNCECNSYNDYSLIKNSIDRKQQGDDDTSIFANKENFTGKNVVCGENAQGSPFSTGFKNFCQ